MNRSLKFLFTSLLIPLIIILVGMKKNSLVLITFGLILACLVTFIHFVLLIVNGFKASRKWVLQFESKYVLELLDNTKNDVFVIKKIISGYEVYVFSYYNDEGKKRTCTARNVEIKKLGNEQPYVHIYKNVYQPKGFLDYLFYTDESQKLYSTMYELCVAEDNIKLNV